MEVDNKAGETPDVFLSALGEILKKDPQVDLGLVDILEAHILKSSPDPNAVVQAKDAIVKLAAGRAEPPKSEVVDE
jgi:hypothetical protein